MRFHFVAERELRAASRRKGTYVVRWVTGAAFFLLFVWLMWAFGGFRNQRVAPDIFNVFSVLTFFYCLIVGTARTADCLSSERREGTLGLLFLTNLNSAEIVAGKLCAHALPTVYGLLAIFPIMAIPLLMGGVTAEHFARTMLALLNAILFSLAAGFVASVLCKRQFTAVALAMMLALVWGAGLLGVAAIIEEFHGPRLWINGFSTLCPLYALVTADGGRIFSKNHYWFSVASVTGTSFVWLGLVTWQLARSWRDRPSTVRVSRAARNPAASVRSSNSPRAALRRRLLAINPFLWLSGRNAISSPVIMTITVGLVLITLFVTAPYFARVIGAGNYKPVAGSLLAWIWTVIAFHLIAFYYAAMISSQRLAEDKETGALELILSTPATEQTIGRGLWLAFGRRMLFPALAATLGHLYFLWQCLVMCTLEPPGEITVRATPGQFLWAALFNEPIGGRMLQWEFCMMMRIAVLILLLTPLLWITLAWLGRWLGLRMKHPGFAPLVAVALVVIPPTLLYSLVCYLGDQARLFNSDVRNWMPIMVWLAVGMLVTHCLLLCSWAAGKLRHDFRAVVIGRFDNKPRSWNACARSILKFCLRMLTLAFALGLLVAGFYGCQNVRIRRNWSTFQARLQQQGKSLELAAILPKPVAQELDFARAEEFKILLAGHRKSLRSLLDKLHPLSKWQPYYNQSPDTYGWTTQKYAPFELFAGWLGLGKGPAGGTNNSDLAPALLATLQPLERDLSALAVAARRPAFQPTTNRTAAAVIQTRRPELQTLERLQFLFTLRSLALLETNDAAHAGEDFITSLHLVRLGLQSPDALAGQRGQVMLVRSFQPLWEGLSRHQWSDAQLAAFQTELAGFNLLASHTNAIRRTVLAHIEIWRTLPESKSPHVALPSADGGYTSNRSWQWQPRTWWLNHCISLYQLGENLTGQMDLTNEYCRFNEYEGTLNNLPLESETQQWLGQHEWYGPRAHHVAVAQTWLNEARLAIALERQRLADGHYPTALKVLVPGQLSHIPKDVARGLPVTYQLVPPGSYEIRGLGFNRINDRTNSNSDDWVWAYPTNAASGSQPP